MKSFVHAENLSLRRTIPYNENELIAACLKPAWNESGQQACQGLFLLKMIRTARCLGVLVLIAAVLAAAYAAGEMTGLLLALSGTSLLTAAIVAAILYRQRPANQLLPQRNSESTPPVPRSQLVSAGLQNEGRRHQDELNLEQTLRGLTHESRDALQQGQACLELLALKTRDQPELQELVADIQKALDRLLHLYENARRQCSTNYGGP